MSQLCLNCSTTFEDDEGVTQAFAATRETPAEDMQTCPCCDSEDFVERNERCLECAERAPLKGHDDCGPCWVKYLVNEEPELIPENLELIAKLGLTHLLPGDAA